MTIKTVNEIGLAEIKDFLARNHKLGGDHFGRDMLLAWACGVNFQLDAGNPPTLELKSWETVSGATKTYTISDAGIDSGDEPTVGPTPGPFPLTAVDIGYGEIAIVTNQGNHYAKTYDPEAARVIMAAPDLLAALEQIARLGSDGDPREALTEIAVKSIAKAKGVN